MNTKLRKEVKNEFEKDFFKLKNNAVFRKTMENVRKHRDIKLVTTDRRRNPLVSEPNYHRTTYFSENLLAIEMKKTKVKKNKPIYLSMSILDISKTLMYEFWYDYIKPKYGDTDSFVIHIITEDFYEDIAGNVERWFDISNYDENDERLLPMGKDKKEIGFLLDEWGGNIKKEFVGLRAKAWAYILNGWWQWTEKIGTKKCVIKRRLMFENYKGCVLNNKIILKPQQGFKSDHHDVYTVEINKKARC